MPEPFFNWIVNIDYPLISRKSKISDPDVHQIKDTLGGFQLNGYFTFGTNKVSSKVRFKANSLGFERQITIRRDFRR
jgi:hypothetical protein